MKQPEIDYWITAMLETYGSVSDLNVTAGKPLQVESSGQMVPVPMEPAVPALTPFQTEVFALNLIRGDNRLLNDLVSTGSCTKMRPIWVSPSANSALTKSSSTLRYWWKSSASSFWSMSSRTRIIENSKNPAMGGGRT